MLTLTRDALLVSQSAGLVQLSHGWYFSAQRRRCGLEFSAQMTPFLHWFNVGAVPERVVVSLELVLSS